MNVRFRQNMKVEVVVNDDIEERVITFGEIHKVREIIECLDDANFVDIYFTDGSILYGLRKDAFTLMGGAKITKPLEQRLQPTSVESTLIIDEV